MEEPWTDALSHEALELIGDPEANLLVVGPNPTDRRKKVFPWYEMCDAVQAESYDVDGVLVSNFVLPLYFTCSDERGGRNDFLGRSYNGQTLQSFGVNPGGYLGYYDPQKRTNASFFARGDLKAEVRLQIKHKAKGARRSIRYSRLV